MFEIVMSVYSIILYSIPVIIVVLFGICLYRYISAKNQNKNAPGTFPPEEILRRKIFLILASIALGIVVAVVLGFIVLMYMVIAYM